METSGKQELAEREHLLALEVICEAWTNSVGDVQSSFPVVGWNLSSHVPVEGQMIFFFQYTAVWY